MSQGTICKGVMRYQQGGNIWLAQAEMGYEHQIEPTADFTLRLAEIDENLPTIIKHVGASHTITLKFSDNSAAGSLTAGQTGTAEGNSSGAIMVAV